MNKSIHDLLSSWGSSQRTVPEHNEVLKAAILAHVPPTAKAVAPLRRSRPWLSLALGAFAVLAFMLQKVEYFAEPESTLLSVRSSEPSEQGVTLDSLSSSKNVYYAEPAQKEIPVTDNREFLKTDYRASIKTRNVTDLASRIQTTIRGFDGRIDSVSTSPKQGYIGFAVPAKQFDAFRMQLQSLAGERYLVETTTSQNMLSQKQSIEEQQNEINTNLTVLTSQRSRLIAHHRAAIANLQGDELAAEQASYNKQLSSYNAQIRSYEANLASLNKQDKQLVDTVATVQGSISLQWISVWDVLELYVGPYWLPILLLLAAIAAYVVRTFSFVIA